MGSDKATIDVNGQPLAAFPYRALAEAGAERVFCLGGDTDSLGRAGLEIHSDREPGQGPLAAITHALGLVSTEVLVVMACDLPNANAEAVIETVIALRHPYDAAMPSVGGVPQYLHGAYRRSLAEVFGAALGRGELSLRAALTDVSVATVAVADPASLADADHPEDLE
jgi:molybdopterin-guanine dinucleotide biosynthesis protein A